MSKIDPKNAFIHVTYEYRCLVRAEYLFRISKTIDNDIIKETGTVARNAVLSKARSLIDFYTKQIGGRTPDTDITFYDYFGASYNTLNASLSIQDWININKSIEAHDLHLTAYRDEEYREKYLMLNNKLAEEWKDWDKLQSNIVDELVMLLNLASSSLEKWGKPFSYLYTISNQVLKNGGSWEENLSEPQKILNYLKQQGL